MTRPPGDGNSLPKTGASFIIGLKGTELVFTTHGDDVRLNSYEPGNDNQMWQCTLNPHGWGFTNHRTGKYLNVNQYGYIGASKTEQLRWESFLFQPDPGALGGYWVLVIWNSAVHRLRKAPDGRNYAEAAHDLTLPPTLFCLHKT
ncbi:hypothetical protein AbraIFM66950_001915 [Aspergillus brasiliensis]|nr:hypothetical protein AbraIFM66950_001915 [Aspergillus brasiliensis]